MPALLSVVLAGAAAVPAVPVQPNTWFTSKDNPKTALAVADRGQVAYRIDVAPDGTAIRCTPAEDTDLGRKVCELVMKHARFQPAKDDQGQAAYGLHDGVASFLMPGGGRRPDRSRLAVTVDSLPGGAASPAYAKVAFAVDSSGAIGGCASTPGERRRNMQTIEALGPAACAALAKDFRPTPARDAAGTPVVSVQSAIVRFELRAAS